MNAVTRFLALSISAIQCASAILIPVELALSTAGQDNRIEVSIAVGFLSDSDTTQLTGTVQAIVDVDLTAATASQLRFFDGDIDASDMSFTFGFPPNFGQEARTLDVSGLPLDRTSAVSATGEVDAAPFRILLNEGTLESSGSVAGSSSTSLADEPLELPGNGIGSVVVTALGDNRYSVRAELPVMGDETFDADGTEIDLSYNGNLVAAGEFTFDPDGFVAWAGTAGITPLFDVDSNGDGLPNGVAFALGLAPDAAAPNLFTADGLDLGSLQTRLPITVECDTTLADNDWDPLSAAQLSTSANPLPVGSSGNITITRGSEPAKFYRLSTDEPSPSADE